MPENDLIQHICTSYDFKKWYNEHLCNIGKIGRNMTTSYWFREALKSTWWKQNRQGKSLIWKNIYIALVECYNYQNWTSTSQSKYVPQWTKLLIHVPLKFGNGLWIISSHTKIYDGCNYLSMLGLKVIFVDKRGLRLLWVRYQHTWHNSCMYYVYHYLISIMPRDEKHSSVRISCDLY